MQFIKNTIQDKVNNITITVLATEKLTPQQTANVVAYLIKAGKVKCPKKGHSLTVTYTGPANMFD